MVCVTPLELGLTLCFFT